MTRAVCAVVCAIGLSGVADAHLPIQADSRTAILDGARGGGMTPDWAVFGNGGKPILVVWFPVGGNATRLLLYFEDNGAWTLARNEMIDVSPTISPCLSTSSSRLTVLGLGDIPIREFSLLGLRPWRMPVETFLLPIKHLDPQLAIW